jgi:hypothetical protein
MLSGAEFLLGLDDIYQSLRKDSQEISLMGIETLTSS